MLYLSTRALPASPLLTEEPFSGFGVEKVVQPHRLPSAERFGEQLSSARKWSGDRPEVRLLHCMQLVSTYRYIMVHPMTFILGALGSQAGEARAAKRSGPSAVLPPGIPGSKMKFTCPSGIFFVIIAAATALERATIAAVNTRAECSIGAGSTDDHSSPHSCSLPYNEDDTSALRNLEAYTALLEERILQHERQQQQNTFFIFLAVGICVGVVIIVAIAASKVYIQSLLEQLHDMPHQVDRNVEHVQESRGEGTAPLYRKVEEAGGAQQRRLPQQEKRVPYTSTGCNASSSSSKDIHGCAAFLEAMVNDSSDEEEIRLWPSKEDIGKRPHECNESIQQHFCQNALSAVFLGYVAVRQVPFSVFVVSQREREP
ncbi:hypothetical protein cyc_07375 [Cyclospora cayetanensis]|uniref:Transmembrane protein n=1 Tax=Cyclospora cayetanensis TaxID=88456 RepID=A0A1D3D2R9_9EIME|nr:hypothetical protein cyc_07375 [Cyclospora cayetanensis]